MYSLLRVIVIPPIAVPPQAPALNGARGMGGTLVSAVFESLGYQYQAYLIDNFEQAFKGPLGGLVFLIGIIAAIFSVAIRGNYKLTTWLLIGPPLFFAAVMKRAPAAEVEWRFAKQAREQEEVQNILADMNAEGFAVFSSAQGANVSKLFQHYNHLISESSQEIVKIINGTRRNTDRWFINKGRMLAALYSSSVQFPGLHQLINWGMMGECRDVVEAARIIADPLSTRDMRDTANLAEKLDRRTNKLPRDAAEFVADTELFALNNFANAIGGLFPGAAQALAAIMYQIRANRVQYITENHFTCRQIWNWIHAGLMRVAYYRVDRIAGVAVNNEIDRADFLQKLDEAASGTPGNPAGGQAAVVQRLQRIAALYILRNTVRAESRSGRIDLLHNQSTEHPTMEASLEGELALTEFARTSSTEWAEKTRMLMSAENLPYYQGLLLFFLACAYPFFAMLLLVPGKHAGFMLWFVLWMWVKSWDVGFALVMQLDDILFSIFGLHMRYVNQRGGARNEISIDLATTMWAVRECDPSFNLSTYYNIMAVCLLSIPVISSQIILGGLTGGASLVAAGMNTALGEFARGAQTTQAQAAISNLRYEMQDFKQQYAEQQQRFVAGVPVVKSLGTSGAPFPYAMGGAAVPGFKGGESFRSDVVGGGKTTGTPRAHTAFSGYDHPPWLTGRAVGDSWWKAKDMSEVAGLGRGAVGQYTVAGILGTIRAGFHQKSHNQAQWDRIKKGLGFGVDVVGVIGKLAALGRDVYMGTADADFQVVNAGAVSDAIYSDRGKRLAFLIRLYGGIEVPITAERPSLLAESDREIKYLKMQMDAYATVLDSMADTLKAGERSLEAWNNFRKSSKDHADLEAARKLDRDNAAHNKKVGRYDKPVGHTEDFFAKKLQAMAPPGFWSGLTGEAFGASVLMHFLPRTSTVLPFLNLPGGWLDNGIAPVGEQRNKGLVLPVPDGKKVSFIHGGEGDLGPLGGGPIQFAFAEPGRGGGVFDGEGFGFEGFGRGGLGENKWMETSPLLASASGGGSTGGGGGVVYVSTGGGDSGDGGPVLPGPGPRFEADFGATFVQVALGSAPRIDFGGGGIDTSWAFQPVDPGGPHHSSPHSDSGKHFQPVNLDRPHEEGAGETRLAANIVIGELPLDLTPMEREEIERNPDAARDIIERRRGGSKGGGGGDRIV